MSHFSIMLYIAGLSPKDVGRENKLDDMIIQWRDKNENDTDEQ